MVSIRKGLFGNRVTISPEDNVIIGAKPILRYLGFTSVFTLYRWVDDYGFPAIKRPDGKWMTTITAIDEWIFLGAAQDAANRPEGRVPMNRRSNYQPNTETFERDSSKWIEKRKPIDASINAARAAHKLDT